MYYHAEKAMRERAMREAVGSILKELLVKSDDRPDFIRSILLDISTALAELAANPAALVPDPERDHFSEVDVALSEWAKRSAKALERILLATL
jgi:hypothetical protein